MPGEDGANVSYRLDDPEDHAGRRVLVVGGGDSALEAAIALARTGTSAVTLSYRGAAFTRARRTNRETVQDMAAAGLMDVMLGSEVLEIGGDRVTLATHAGQEVLPNDAVIVCAGGVLPISLLKNLGIAVERKFGTV